MAMTKNEREAMEADLCECGHEQGYHGIGTSQGSGACFMPVQSQASVFCTCPEYREAGRKCEAERAGAAEKLIEALSPSIGITQHHRFSCFTSTSTDDYTRRRTEMDKQEKATVQSNFCMYCGIAEHSAYRSSHCLSTGGHFFTNTLTITTPKIITDNSKVNENLIAELARLRAEVEQMKAMLAEVSGVIGSTWTIGRGDECDEYTLWVRGSHVGDYDNIFDAYRAVKERE